MEKTNNRTNYEQTIHKLEREKELLLSAISQFYHDASQPLTSLGIWLELAKNDAAEAEDLEMANHSYKHLHQLIVKLRKLQNSFNLITEQDIIIKHNN
jgi:hypothetical protein